MPRPRELLLAAAETVDRLVLLGDVIELIELPPTRSLAVAEPLMRALGERVGEIIVVPGNHDRGLISGWLRARREPLEVATLVPVRASGALQRLTGWLGPARVRVHYPGVWLSEKVWATHGHYLGRHLLPESSYGVARGLLGRLPRDDARPEDYETASGTSASAHAAGLPARRARARPRRHDAGRPAPPAPARHPAVVRAGPGFQMRRASIPALARVVHRLGIDADDVIFGHVHRLGPLPGDDPAQWRGPNGAPRVLNTGAWTYEPLLLHRAAPPHPYWPGGAICSRPMRHLGPSGCSTT